MRQPGCEGEDVIQGFNTFYSPEKPKRGLAAEIKAQVGEKNPPFVFLPHVKPLWVQD